jgi:hypothetical protein
MLLGALIVLVALAIAAFIVTLVLLQRSRSQEQSAREEEARARASSPGDVQGAATERRGEARPAEPLGRPGEVMSVLRDQATGRVLVEVDGRRYAHIREIEDAQVGRSVLWTIADLVRFTGGMATNPRALRNLSEQSEPGAGPGAVSVSAVLTAASTTPATSRYGLVEFFTRGLEPLPSNAPIPSGSFIDEIDAILQEKVARLSPPLSTEVHVTTGSENSLRIMVGGKVYGNPDEIPDPRVRELIRAAVHEWERI